MNILGNILWLIFGGFIIAMQYFVGGLLMMITIVGIPFGLQAFKLGILALWPFASKVTPTSTHGGCFNTLFNIIWLFLAGFWIALNHLFWGIILSITIVGIPFGRQHFKMAGLALTPFGYTITN
jgi:uncharacterized membrane protein YccF (DUF307 family)